LVPHGEKEGEGWFVGRGLGVWLAKAILRKRGPRKRKAKKKKRNQKVEQKKVWEKDHQTMEKEKSRGKIRGGSELASGGCMWNAQDEKGQKGGKRDQAGPARAGFAQLEREKREQH